jgi:hypothetical protein
MIALCYVNHDLKAIYIHTPKTGGIYVKNILETYYGFKPVFFHRKDHDLFNENKNFIKLENIQKKERAILYLRNKGFIRYHLCEDFELFKIWNDYYKFTFVRNPYDRIVSAYKYLNKIKDSSEYINSFKDFIYLDEICSDYNYLHTFITQNEHLIDNNNEININYIGRYENLNIELIKILKNIGVTKFYHQKYLEENIVINGSDNEKKLKYTDYYDEDCLIRVNDFFKKDFSTFKFKRCNSINELIEDSIHFNVTDEKIIRENNECLNKIDICDKIKLPNNETISIKYNSNTICKKTEIEALQSNINEKVKQMVLSLKVIYPENK